MRAPADPGHRGGRAGGPAACTAWTAWTAATRASTAQSVATGGAGPGRAVTDGTEASSTLHAMYTMHVYHAPQHTAAHRRYLSTQTQQGLAGQLPGRPSHAFGQKHASQPGCGGRDTTQVTVEWETPVATVVSGGGSQARVPLPSYQTPGQYLAGLAGASVARHSLLRELQGRVSGLLRP